MKHTKGKGGTLVPLRRSDLLADAEVSEDIVEDGVTCDVGSGDFTYGRDSTTKVGRQEVCGKAIRQPRTHGP